MKTYFIETGQPNETNDLETFWKKVSEHNARVRAYRILLDYIKDGSDKRLALESINLEGFFQQILDNRPSVYHYNPNQDAKALVNLKTIMQSIDEDNKRISIYLANMKYRYAADAIRALDKFTRELSRFNPNVRLQDDVAKQIEFLKKHMGFAKTNFGKQFKKYWSGHMSYVDSLQIADYGEENGIYVDALFLAKSIQWFSEIKSLVRKKSELAVKPKEIHPELHRAQNATRRYIDSEIELYQTNQELAKLRAELAKAKTK